MAVQDLQARCALGQQQLMEMGYLAAEATLAGAEREAWANRDFDTLARLYMPLQEARRQIRQRCGEGIVCLDLLAEGPEDEVEGRRIVENYPHGQLLVAGWRSFEPAVEVRACRAEHGLYVETFLGAVYPVGQGRAIVIAPLAEAPVPEIDPDSLEDLKRQLPPHCLVLAPEELPQGIRKGTPETFGEVMDLWERLHRPFLEEADGQADPIRKIEGYRKTIRVDYACELAHQKLSDVAKELARRGGG